MSEAFATLTKQAVSLPYEEQVELLNSISLSISKLKSSHRKRLDFDSYVIPCERANFADKYIEELRINDRV